MIAYQAEIEWQWCKCGLRRKRNAVPMKEMWRNQNQSRLKRVQNFRLLELSSEMERFLERVRSEIDFLLVSSGILMALRGLSLFSCVTGIEGGILNKNLSKSPTH